MFIFNQYFQTQSVVTNLHNIVNVLYQEILSSFLRSDYFMQTKLSDINPKNVQFQLTDRQLYLVAKVRYIDTEEVVKNNVWTNFF